MQSKINNSLLALAYLIPVPIGLLFNIPAVWYGEGTGGRLGAIAIVALFAIGLLSSVICVFRCGGWQKLLGGVAATFYCGCLIASRL